MEILVLQYAAAIIAVIASVFLDRKIFILMNFALFSSYGIVCMLFPKMILDLYVLGTPNLWHVMTTQFLGLVVFGSSLILWLYRNSADERVAKSLLSLLAQSFVSVLVVLILAVKQRDGLKPSKGEVVFKAVLNNQLMLLTAILLVLWFVAVVVHYLRSPTVKPTVPYHYDRQLNLHQSVLYYSLFVQVLIFLLAPEMSLRTFVKNTTTLFDSTMGINIQLIGVLALTHCAFIVNSKDFEEKEEQGKIFQANLLLMAIQMVNYGTHILFLKTFTFIEALPMLTLVILTLVNSILGYRRSLFINVDYKRDAKKRR